MIKLSRLANCAPARCEYLELIPCLKIMVAPDEVEINSKLQDLGISYGVRELQRNASLCPDCAAELLELFRAPSSIYMRAALAEAVFARKLDAQQKTEAVDLLLRLIQDNPTSYGTLLSLVANELADNVTTNKAHEVGQMVLDPRYGYFRAALISVLGKIRNADAIAYLKQAAKDPKIAAPALDELARLREEGTLELCEAALTQLDLKQSAKERIKKTQAKLKRLAEKTDVGLSHVVKTSIPDGLSEWSANLDGSETQKQLKHIQKCLDGGFRKPEISEVQNSADELSPDQEVRFKFDVTFNGQKTALWLKVHCDDEDAYDLYVFGPPALISLLRKRHA